jgi:hypothetical protein
MNRIGSGSEWATYPARWILIVPAILQLACAPEVAPAPEPVTVKQSAVTFATLRFPISEEPIEVINANSRKCLDVAFAGTGNWTNVMQSGCNGGNNQRFFFTVAGPDSYQIRLGHVAGRNVDVADGSLQDGANIQIFDVVTDAQPFGLVAQSDGSYEIVSKKSGKCLDVANASTADGANVMQFTCHGGANQRWFLNPRSVGMNLIAQHSNKCVDIVGGSTADQTQAQQSTCVAQGKQAFSLGMPVILGTTTYYPLVAGHSGKCLEVAGSSLLDRGLIQQSVCNGNDNQSWLLTEHTDGYLEIKNKRSGKCLDVAQFNMNDGGRVQQLTCSGETKQRWYASIFSSRHVQLVQVARSSGANRQLQDDGAMTDQVTKHGAIYGRYGIRLTYDPATDKSNVDNDALFNLGGGGTFTCPDGSVGTPQFCAERYVLNWPDRLVIFSVLNGSSSASASASYIVVAGALASNFSPAVCPGTIVTNTQLLSHLFGFYLGMVDTFSFNGDDLISDTRPDPRADSCLAPTTPTGVFSGATVDTNNVMSGYFNKTPIITAMQSSQARAAAYVRRPGFGGCGGQSHAGCATTSLFCELPATACSTTGTLGMCTTRPTTCDSVFVPVCGCDGRSYSNDCERQAAGVPKWADGVCSSPGCTATVPQVFSSCSPADMSCVYFGPSAGCVQRMSCVDGLWLGPIVACGF